MRALYAATRHVETPPAYVARRGFSLAVELLAEGVLFRNAHRVQDKVSEFQVGTLMPS
jgi:hypothetical protein